MQVHNIFDQRSGFESAYFKVTEQLVPIETQLFKYFLILGYLNSYIFYSKL